MDGLFEQIEGDVVFVRLVDGQAWRFGLKQFEEVTTRYDWQGEILGLIRFTRCRTLPLCSTSPVSYPHLALLRTVRRMPAELSEAIRRA